METQVMGRDKIPGSREASNRIPETSTATMAGPVPVGQEIEVVTLEKGKFTRTFNPVTPKPSLLRRARPSVAKPPKLLSPEILYTQPQTQIAISPSIRPPASAGFIQRTSVSFQTAQTTSVEEIVLWEPDTEECEIVEVDESELQELFHQRQQPTSDIQQIIVCDGENVPFADFLQNYYLEVIPQPDPIATTTTTTSATVKQRNKKPPKASTKKISTELKCMEEDCIAIAHNVIDLRKHLQDEHKFEFEEEQRSFESDEEFKTWRTSYERERRVSFIYRGGTKKISPEKAVTYLICHRSGYYKPTVGAHSERKRKLKPQGSCKIGTHCTAGIKLMKSLTTGRVEATICHTHYGHDNENIQHLRLNSVVKNLVMGKLNDGYSFRQLLEYVHHNPDGIQGMGVVDRRAIRNIYDQWRRTQENEYNNERDADACENDDSTEETAEDPLPETNLKVEHLERSSSAKRSERSVKDEKNEMTSGDDEGRETNSGGEDEVKKNKPSTSKNKAQNTTQIVKSEKPELADSDTVGESDADGNIVLYQTDVANEQVMSESEAKTLKPRKTEKAKAKPKRLKPLPLKEPPEDVHETVYKLLKHGDSGPTVLFYKKPNKYVNEYGDKSTLVCPEDMCIIIQTPIQRQLLQMNGKIINIEVIEGYDLDLLVLSILDEFLTSVPVAWMITSHMQLDLVEHFFRILQRNCIEIKCQYLLTVKRNDFVRLWVKVFRRMPKLILPQEDTLKELRTLIRRHLDNPEKRGMVLNLLEEMMTTPDKGIFEETLKTLRATTNNADFVKILNRDWIPIRNQWAFHMRPQIHTAVEEAFLRLRKFILFKGTRRMKENIHNILKIGYDRCFQRSKSLFKGDLKIQLAVEEMQAKHGASGSVEKVGDNKYIVHCEFEVYDLDTACTCRLRCEQCEICMHNYWCSCGDRNFCPHAHIVRQFCFGNYVVKSESESEESKESDNTHQLTHTSVDEDAETQKVEEEEGEEGEDQEITEITECSRSSSPELIIPEKCEPIKRVSARLKKRGKPRSDSEDEDYVVSADDDGDEDRDGPRKAKKAKGKGGAGNTGRGRPRKIFIQASLRKESPQSPSKSSTSGTGSQRESETRIESVREELMGLLGKLDTIRDARVMTEVKKRVSDISAVVHLGFNGQI